MITWCLFLVLYFYIFLYFLYLYLLLAGTNICCKILCFIYFILIKMCSVKTNLNAELPPVWRRTIQALNISNKIRLWPWCSWHWCSGLAPSLPPGSSGSPGSQGLNKKDKNKQTTRVKQRLLCFFWGETIRWITDLAGWFCICLSSCVLGHPALQRSQSSEGSSDEKTGTGWTLKQTHLMLRGTQI